MKVRYAYIVRLLYILMRTLTSSDILRIALKLGGASVLLYVIVIEILIFSDVLTLSSTSRLLCDAGQSHTIIHVLTL